MAINPDQIEWASDSVTDPLTGAANKVAPTAEFQTSGLDRSEPLARAHVNYQFDKYHEFFTDIQNQINELAVSAGSALLQQIFHVGAHYYSDSDVNPTERFGFGTWQRICVGRFLAGYDSSDTDFNAAGKAGGSKTHSHSNNISINSAGAHTHETSRDGWGAEQEDSGDVPNLPEPSTAGRLVTGSGRSDGGELEGLAHASRDRTSSVSGTHTHTTTGGIDAASNLPPYRVAFMWVRTA